MPSFRDLSTLAAFDPMPTQLGPVKRPFDPSKPLFDAAALAAHNFERTPHELHSREPRSAGSITGRLTGHSFDLCWFDESTAFRAAACAAELLRPVLSHGDQRDPGQGQCRDGDEGRSEAGNRADPRDAGGRLLHDDFEQIQVISAPRQQGKASKTRWTSAARFALTEVQFAEFKDWLGWLQVLEIDKPLNVYSKQRNVIKQIKDVQVAYYVQGAFYSGEHKLI